MVCKLNATIVHRACFVGRFADLALPNPVCKPRSPVVWTLPQPDYAHSGGDRTVGDDDALASAANELRYLGGETRKLFCVERVGARPSENAGAELEENAPRFSGHAELLSKLGKRKRAKAISAILSDRNYTRDRNIGGTRLLTAKLTTL